MNNFDEGKNSFLES